MIGRWTSESLASRCAADGEFVLAARHWRGGLRLRSNSASVAIGVDDGMPLATVPAHGGAGVIELSADDAIWSALLAATPPRLLNDIGMLLGAGVQLEGDPIVYAQYYPAIMRVIELMRPDVAAAGPRDEARPEGSFDAPVGRYVHVTIAGQDYRLYVEEAGTGIPVLLQHTAGCHGGQWRHLLECDELSQHFRFIAYDLPFHGKSIPPVGPRWWSERYRLEAGFLRAVPVSLARALRLDRPMFMGCSVGGLLALDLARVHPDVFRAVISLEGALKIEGDIDSLANLWHPQVGNEYKARLMNALMSPMSPAAYRKETSQVYASGWPPAFLGDLHYYIADYDLREGARDIDTSKVSVDILSGEYDASGTCELGQAAHAAIPGSTWTEMKGVGHFPMSENPEAFIRYITPVLARIRARHLS